MASKRKNSGGSDSEKRVFSAEERIARTLGLLLVQSIAEKSDQAPRLRAAGFEVRDIAEMLSMTENHVSVAIYQSRKVRKKKK